MKLKTMFALKTGAIAGGEIPQLPYQFAAAEKLHSQPGETNFHCIVNIVMPLGGSQSALFRYPKEGEKVLVGIEDNEAFLMGYMPENPNDNIHTGAGDGSVLPEEMAGQFFRYKGTKDGGYETIDGKGTYSELGFYRETAKWKPLGADDSEPYPEITAMKISSSGDLHQTVKNHQLTKAKRFELLVDCDGPADYTKETDEYEDEDFAFGDSKGDDPQLYAGDAHIRAKRRIVIKAGEEIQLEVGRSVVVINDTGVSVVSRKTKAKDSNAWDSRLAVCAKDGVGMFGQWLNMKAGLGFDLGEGYGGSMSSKLGVTRIEGLDVRLSTIGTKNYSSLGVSNSADFTASCIDNKGEGEGSLSKASRLGGGALGNLTANSLKDLSDWGDPARSMLQLMEMMMISNSLVGLELEQELPEEDLDDLHQALACTEFDAVKDCFDALSSSCAASAIFETALHLHRNAKLDLNAKTINHYNVDNNRYEIAEGGISKKTVQTKVGGEAKDFSRYLYETASQGDIPEEARSL